MCGICGFVNYKDEELLRKMLDKLIHRGPDEEGIYTEDSLVSLGIRRLKIIDLLTGSQPIMSEDGNVVVVCNGEIYNFRELRNTLESKGHIFKSKSDVEVIVHLYEDYGLDFVKYLRGMFAIALWDKKTKTLVLVRDHFGIKPLHYIIKDKTIFFSSEISALYLVPGINFEIDKDALSYFFSLLYTPEPYTIIKQIKKLPAASLLVWRNNNFYIRKYWELNTFSQKENLKEEFIIEKIYELFYLSIKEQLVSDVPLGVFLSGGLDSSAIVAFMKKFNIGKIETFSVGFGEEDITFNELKKAKIISEFFNTNHNVKILTPQIEKVLLDILEKSGEPFGDSSIIPTYLISQFAKNKITVALSGIGGDELFGGYPRYIGAYFAQIYLHTPLFFQRCLFEFSKIFKITYQKRDLINWIKRFLYISENLKEKYILWVSSLDLNDKDELFLEKELKKFDTDFLPSINTYEDIYFFDISTYLKDNLLFLADRASMANSLELRVPFLDVRLVEFLSKVSLKSKTKKLTLKYFLRKILEMEGLPLSIVKQKKQGFQIPLGRWLIEEIKELMFDYLNPHTINSEGLINYNYLQKIIKQHLNKTKNYSDLLFTILVWEMWREKFLKLLSLNLKRAIELKNEMKILLINLGGLGDIIMMMPIIKALYDRYSNSKFFLLTISRSQEIAQTIPYFSEIITLPIHYKMFKFKKIKSLIKLLIGLKNIKFDFVINLRKVNSLLGMLKILIIKTFINSDFFIGYGKKFSRRIFNFFYDEEDFPATNEVEITYKLLEPLGIKGKPDYIFYPIRIEAKQWSEEFIRNNIKGSKILVGFCPGAFRPSRRWPLEYWRDLAFLIKNIYSYASIFIFGSKEEDKLMHKTFSDLDFVIITNNITDKFEKLAALMEKMDIIVSNDTGLMHLAAALNKKVICIFGPGDVVRYAPYVEKDKIYILRKENIKCKRPCYKYQCKNLKCLKEITPKEVLNILKNLV